METNYKRNDKNQIHTLKACPYFIIETLKNTKTIDENGMLETNYKRNNKIKFTPQKHVHTSDTEATQCVYISPAKIKTFNKPTRQI